MKLEHWEPDLRTLISRVNEGEIDLQPNFQRGDIWPSAKKRKLIDTVLRGWSIPPIHIVVTPTGTMEVLDGQQRLTSIRDFMNGDFKVDGRIEPADENILGLSGKTYEDLPLQVRRTFDRYTLRVFRITDYKPEEPGELFYRLNQPLSLTAGEQRNALYGPARAQLKELVAEFEEQGNNQKNIGFSNVRMSYDDVFAKLIYFFEHKTFGIKATESAISDRFKSAREFDSVVVARTHSVIRMFSIARQKSEGLRLNKATLLSWFLFYSRSEENAQASTYLRDFELAREVRTGKVSSTDALTTSGSKPLPRGENFVRLFVDRASLRVSDVSSVVYRDFALWAVYCLNKRTAPETVRVEDIRRIDSVTADSKASLESALDDTLDAKLWAAL